MKRVVILLIAIVLASCAHVNKPQTEPAQIVQVEIAKVIWDAIVAEDSLIGSSVEAARTFVNEEYETQNLPEYLSNTHMKYYRMGEVSEGQIDQVAYYEMQCYPMKDHSWIAVVYGFFNNNCDYGPCLAGLYSYHFKEGELLGDNPPIGLPSECPQSAMKSMENWPWMRCAVDFDETGFVVMPNNFWPIRYNWTGERFEMDSQSVMVANDFNNGDIAPYDFSRKNTRGLDYYPFEVGPDYLITNGETGEQVLQLEFENEQLSVINILSPKIGIAFTTDWMSSPYSDYYLFYNTSLPVALGQPIRNVLESEKSEDLHKEILESTQDGRYTLTQHLKVDKSNHKDIFAEYQAKDKDSRIERFRIFGLPLAITLDSELEASNVISDEVKQFWAIINADDAVTKDMPGTFKRFWESHKNGFAAIFHEDNDRGGYVEWKLTYAMLTANDGRQIAYIRKNYYDRAYAEKPQAIVPEWEQYLGQDGEVRRVEPELPMPQLTDFPAYNLGDKTVTMEGENSSIGFRCDGSFSFFAHSDHYQSFGDESDDAYVRFYQSFFHWDGEKFVNEQ